LATKLLCRINPDKTLNLHANFLDIAYSVAIRHPLHIPPLPSLTINPQQLPCIFQSCQLTDSLQSIANSNHNLTTISFYTDGSVIELGTPQCSMGIGWVQVDNSTTIHSFHAQVKLWPCSFKAEILAILSAIITAPRNCSVHIFTDSQSVISKYYSICSSASKLSHTHTPYFSIWQTLINFINSYNIQLTFHKVTAHQDDPFNNLADQLARNHQILPFLTFSTNNPYNSAYTPFYDQFPIEIPTRRSIRTICQAHIITLWTSQHRFQQWSTIASNINWEATWLYINNNQKISNFAHSFHSSTLKTFRVKILLDELPVPHTLHKRNSSYSPLCHQCNQTSSSLHWTLCPSTHTIYHLISNSLNCILNATALDMSANSVSNLHQEILTLNSFKLHNFSHLPSLISTLSGLVPIDLISTIYNTSIPYRIATSLSIKFLLHLNQQIYKQLWIPYCISRSAQSSITSSTNSTHNSSFSLPLPPISIPQIITKIDLWTIQWIKYHIPLSYIITNTQI
jgi:ribonuclease HI